MNQALPAATLPATDTPPPIDLRNLIWVALALVMARFVTGL